MADITILGYTFQNNLIVVVPLCLNVLLLCLSVFCVFFSSFGLCFSRVSFHICVEFIFNPAEKLQHYKFTILYIDLLTCCCFPQNINRRK